MKSKTRFILSGIYAAMFAVLIILLKTVDVAQIGPEQTSVGFASINQAVHGLLGENELWYEVTDKLGKVILLIPCIFALVGLIQLIQRKSLVKVDYEVLSLGGLYVVTAACYALFEVWIINYRPVLMQNERYPEASFPSSHTVLACVILGSTIIVLNRYIKAKSLRIILQILCEICLVVLVVGRLMSGVHWFTDILGGLTLSAALLAGFSGILGIVSKKGR